MINITTRAAIMIAFGSLLLLGVATEHSASAGAAGCSPPAPVGIPDADPGGVNIDCVISSAATINGLTVFLQIDHTWVGDLTVTLTHVDTGTAISLIDRPGAPVPTSIGCGGDNILVTLDDAAGAPIENECANGVPTISGTLQPNSPLSAFDSQSLGGTWRLNVADNQDGDFGQVVQWTLGSCLDTDGDGQCDTVDLDDDADGCADVAENQTAPGSETSGGRRNPLNFWDFYDVPTGPGLTRDSSVSGTDIFQIIGRFNTTGNLAIDPLSAPPATGYHSAYDRGPPTSAEPWDLSAANGSITGTDIFGVIGQFNHSCAA